MQKAEVYQAGELAGVLIEENRQKYVFRYADEYFLNQQKLPISLTFPKSQKEFESKTLFPFFSNMIAEGANLAIQCQYLKKDERDVLGLLGATANTDTIGSVTLKIVEIV